MLNYQSVTGGQSQNEALIDMDRKAATLQSEHPAGHDCRQRRLRAASQSASLLPRGFV